MIRQEKIRREEIVIENGHDVLVPDGQVILFEQYALLRRTWKWVLLISVVATAAIGAFVIFAIPKEYKAVVTVVPPNKQGTPLDNLLGGVASSLKDFGLTKLVGGKSGENGYSRVALLTSQPVLDSLIEKYDLFSVYDIPPEQRDMMRSALTENIEVDISPEGPISVGIYDVDPKRSASMANDAVQYTNWLAREMNRRETEPITKYVGESYTARRNEQERLGRELQMFMQKNKIIDVENQAEAIGGALMDAEVNVMSQRSLVEIYSRKFGDSDPQTIQARDLLREYEKQSQRLAAGRGGVLASLDVKNVPAATVEYLRIRADYEINAKVLAILAPLYEQSKFDEVKNIPVLGVLSAAEAPVKKARPRYSIVILTAFLGTIIISYVFIACIAYARAFQRRYRMYTLNVNGAVVAHTNGDSRGEYLP